MGRERELKLQYSSRSVVFLAGHACFLNPWAFLGFRPLAPHGSGQRSSPRHTPPARCRRERKQAGEQQQPGGRAGSRKKLPPPPPLPPRLYFYSILSSPSSVLSPPVPRPAPPFPLRLLLLPASASPSSPTLRFLWGVGGLR